MKHRVVWLETGQSFDVEPGEAVLAAAHRAEIDLPNECQFGGCGTCRIRLMEGSVGYVSEENETGELPIGLNPEEAEAGYALACQARPACDLVISVLPPVQCSEPTRLCAIIERVQPLSNNVMHLQLRLPEEAQILFRPGQYMNVLLPDSRHRSFSMASRPGGSIVDFHIRRIPGGSFTDEQLPTMGAGHSLEVELPLGGFCYQAKDERPLVMVATGTGIAPLKSILEALMDDEDCPPVSLYWGMRTEADLYLHDEIQTWSDRLYEFRYVPVLSRPGHKWDGRSGYVQDAVLEDFPELSEHAIYLCGSPQMIADAKAAFVERGASIDHVYSDSFVFQRN